MVGVQIREKVNRVVMELAGVQPAQLTPNARLVEDLDLEPVEQRAIFSAIGEAFGLARLDLAAGDLITFGDLLELVADRVDAKLRP